MFLFFSSVRKNADDLKEALEKVLVPMFCSAMTVASDDQKSKLDKVILPCRRKLGQVFCNGGYSLINLPLCLTVIYPSLIFI